MDSWTLSENQLMLVSSCDKFCEVDNIFGWFYNDMQLGVAVFYRSGRKELKISKYTLYSFRINT